MSDFTEDKMKKMSVYDLENLVAKAISAATGEKFEAKISNLNFKEGGWQETTFNV